MFSRVGKIVAIGRNFAEHAKELGNEVPKSPFFFLKPASSIVREPGNIEIPKGCIVHHEVELGVVIGKTGRDIPASLADSYVAGYVLALDMTARNLQDEAKKKGHPWSTAKGFDTFTAASSFVPKDALPDPHNAHLWLKVDDRVAQSGSTKDMIFKIPQLIEFVSSIMTLEEGDWILTGTPSGVGPVSAGQVLTGGLKRSESDSHNLASFTFPVVDRKGTGLFSKI
ncbi:hypothetical protein BJ742DRAFT_747095 [Cladochytrium replicatum]|nr:hypothetical protein BJ742DRAFT_747095 [Cladochytrium replicatum]